MADAGTLHFGKVILKHSSKMSLNDRFQLMRQTAQRVQLNASNAVNRRINSRQQRQGSAKNRRLALQMANRPAVIAALQTTNNNYSNNRGIKQRLGNNRNNNRGRVLGRLNTPVVANAVNNVRRNRKPLNRAAFGNSVARIGRMPNNAVARIGRMPNNAVAKNRRGFNVRNRIQNASKQKNRFDNRQNRVQRASMGGNGGAAIVGHVRPLGPFRQPKSFPFRNAGQLQSQGNRKKFLINRNFNAQNARNARPQRKRQPQKRKNVQLNRQDLDKDLDVYMARTKTYLDADLDAYMSLA